MMLIDTFYEDPNTADPARVVTNEVTESEIAAKIRWARDQLSPQQALAFTLRYDEELTIKQVAKRMGRKKNTVKTQLQKARSRLAKILGADPIIRELVPDIEFIE